MPRRVRLTWNRNQDLETEYYRVFRDDEPGILQGKNMDKLVMKVFHPKTINPVTIEGERLRRISDTTYQLAHKNILLSHKNDSFPFEIEVDGLPNINFVLDREEGKVIFDSPLSPESIVTAVRYTFDGVQVWDYEIEEALKVYYGPEAKDTTRPNAPTGLQLIRDIENNRVILKWDTATVNGKILYYRIDAAIDDQRYSKLSETKHVLLREPLADRPYIVERSDDNKKWIEVAKVSTNEYYEYAIDRTAPPPIRNLDYIVFLGTGSGKAQIKLQWSEVKDDTVATTSMYRVRARNKVGVISDPSVIVGPIELNVGISHLLIRRKIKDGTLPSYDGLDAETVATITDISITSYMEEVEDNHEYTYGIWVVDKAGNYSTITFTDIYVGDTTPPAIPLDLHAKEFHMVAG
jgi:hypothetical protein